MGVVVRVLPLSQVPGHPFHQKGEPTERWPSLHVLPFQKLLLCLPLSVLSLTQLAGITQWT